MAIVDNQKIMFKAGLQAAYNGMSSRDSGTFYVTTDTNRLYLGDNLLSQAVRFVDSLPSTGIDEGTIYYLTTASVLYAGILTMSNLNLFLSCISSITSFTHFPSNPLGSEPVRMYLSSSSYEKPNFSSSPQLLGRSSEGVLLTQIGGSPSACPIILNSVTVSLASGENAPARSPNIVL